MNFILDKESKTVNRSGKIGDVTVNINFETPLTGKMINSYCQGKTTVEAETKTCNINVSRQDNGAFTVSLNGQYTDPVPFAPLIEDIKAELNRIATTEI